MCRPSGHVRCYPYSLGFTIIVDFLWLPFRSPTQRDIIKFRALQGRRFLTQHSLHVGDQCFPRDQGKKLTGRMAAIRTEDRLWGRTDTPLHLTVRRSWYGARGSHNETLSLSDPLRCLWLSQHMHGPCWDPCRASGHKASFLTRPLLLVVQTPRGAYYLQRGLKGQLHGGPDRWSCCRVPGELDEGRAPSAMHCPKKGRHVQNLLNPHLDKRYAWENLVCILTRKSAFPLKMATQP